MHAWSMLVHEQAAWDDGAEMVVGVDEAGRGPLAGPVVAAAVHIPHKTLRRLAERHLAQLTDSKKLSPRKREEYFQWMQSEPAVKVAVAAVGPRVIDRHNILDATYLAMRRALLRLQCEVDLVLVDGPRVRDLGRPARYIINGDSSSLLIAAASVVAKVVRDGLLERIDRRYPQYGFARHKGYGTREHLEALKEWGPCPEHRLSFRPLRDWFGPAGGDRSDPIHRQMHLRLEEDDGR